MHVLSRVDGVLTNFNRQCSNRRCLVVCHGEVMWAMRLRFERLSQLTYREMEVSTCRSSRIIASEGVARRLFVAFSALSVSACAVVSQAASSTYERIHNAQILW